MVPVGIRWVDSRPIVEWWELGTEQFIYPFFSQTLDRVRLNGGPRSSFVTGIDSLASLVNPEACVDVKGFIFHMSRCGSTLVSRMLAQSPQILVLGQPNLVADLLDSPPGFDEVRLSRWLRDLVSVLIQQCATGQEYYIVKWTSYLALRLDLFRTAFPECKWAFVYRDPVEVMVSVIDNANDFLKMKQDPMKAGKWLGITADEILSMSIEEYVAWILGAICNKVGDAVAQGEPGEALMIDYRGLPEAVMQCVAPHFGIHLNDQEKQAMYSISQFYSKDVHLSLFHADSVQKQQRASTAIREAAVSRVMGPLSRIRGLRGC